MQQRILPQQWPPGRFDLVVFPNWGYYFGAPDADRACAAGALEPAAR